MSNTDIEMQPVTSSNIKAAGYDHSTLRFRVEFSTGKTYLYRGVPQNVADEFFAAPSQGSYFAKSIRGQYSGELE